VGLRSTVVTRAPDGKITAFLNRCTHRGSPVCLQEQGNAPRFTCPYHAWTFSCTGEMLSASFPDGYGPSFDRAAHNLGRFPKVESYRGFVFGCLNPDEVPLIDWMGPAREILDWSIDKDGLACERPDEVRVIKGTQMMYRGNWKHQNDNNTDGYHTPFLHKATNIMNQRRHGSGKWLSHVKDNTSMICQYLGNGHKLGDHRAELRSSWEQARPVPGRESEAATLRKAVGEEAAKDYLELTGRAGINLILYPNLFIMGNGAFAVFEPVSVNETKVRYYTILPAHVPEQVNRLRVRSEEDFNNVGSRDDSDIMERVQHALETIPEMEWLDLTRGMNRQTVSPNGVITSNKTDDTAIRGAYSHWLTLMNKEPRTAVR
jgi:phenylpropionate dioxygenase-like ring-hydroxylating dioxygenase large terminal subunit